MSNSNREFRKIPSALFLYEVSEDGRYVRNVKSKKYLKQHLDRYGYYKVTLSIHGERKYATVHRLVAECWYGECPEGYQVDHIDHNKTNNHYKNLRHVTARENLKNRVLTERFNQHNKEMSYLGLRCTVDGKEFISLTAAAEYIANLHSLKRDTVRYYFKQKRNHIHGHTVHYI